MSLPDAAAFVPGSDRGVGDSPVILNLESREGSPRLDGTRPGGTSGEKVTLSLFFPETFPCGKFQKHKHVKNRM